MEIGAVALILGVSGFILTGIIVFGGLIAHSRREDTVHHKLGK